MIVVTEDKPQVLDGQTLILTDEQKKGIDIIADSLVSSPDKIKILLSKYNVQLSADPSRQELLSGLFIAFNKDENSIRDFALSRTGKNISAVAMDSRSTKSNVTDSYTAATVGIMGSLASIFGMFKGPDPTAAITATNAQILALAAQKEEAKKRNTTIALVVLSALLLIGGVTVVVYYKKNNPEK